MTTLGKMAIAAVALKRYQLRNGNWPENLKPILQELSHRAQRDLADADTIRYHRNSNGTFLLYSAGLDGKDDGGDPDRDLVWPTAAWPESISAQTP